MLVVGMNMLVATKSLGIKLTQKAMYADTKNVPFALYEVANADWLINIPKAYLDLYVAWFTIPSLYKGVHTLSGLVS